MRLDEDDVATLHQQLAWLTKREGFAQRRLAQAGIVDELLRGSLEDSFERLRHRFISRSTPCPASKQTCCSTCSRSAPTHTRCPS
ncbi:hypothetical protein [Gordonia jinhuaensis]|uniref:hypothetical protein n=1 Tax=Gordonia jinhuaensis TaxID=1517702 RepID=UPI001E47DDBB|nr:hypothetical protein [Gordonia jinhuaensis]